MESLSMQKKENDVQSNIHSAGNNNSNLFSHFHSGIEEGGAHKEEEEKGGQESGKGMSGLGEVSEHEPLGGHGRKAGEAIGDAGRVIGTGLGNILGDAVGLLTGINISSETKQAPSWNPNGHFNWSVGFKTSGKKAKNGWIVQRIKNTYRAQKDDGTALPGPVPTKEYWEAWAVDGAGLVSPSAAGANDYWIRPSKGVGSKGHWSMSGKVYFTKTNPATQGFVAKGVPDAGILQSTETEPDGLGIARLHRYAQGTWDSKGHEGSAH